MKRTIVIFVIFVTHVALGWGEAGHHLVGRLSAKLLAHHPLIVAKFGHEMVLQERRRKNAFLNTFYERRFMLGHLGNIPDTYWRNLEESKTRMGNPTHYLNREIVLEMESQVGFAIPKIPADYETAKRLVKKDKPKVNFFEQIGTLPWRAQQFANLYFQSLKQLPREACETLANQKKSHTLEVLTFAGLMSHFTADASVPLHATKYYDGKERDQKGLHSYWESDLVDALEEEDLEKKVWNRALGELSEGTFFEAAKKKYPNEDSKNRVAAYLLTLLDDSALQIPSLESLDRKYALKRCPNNEKNVCRKAPWEKVEGKTIAQWNEPVIVERLALAVAVTTHIWATLWQEVGADDLCFTWDYAHKPEWISPTDPKVAGYETPNRRGKSR